MSVVAVDSRTLMIRSLNETRLLHPPTYVASRYLAASIAADPASSWTPEAILRRFPSQRSPRLFEIVRLKKALLSNSKSGHLPRRSDHLKSPLNAERIP